MTGNGVYCTVGQVFDFLNLRSRVTAEAVGTGDGSTTVFYLDHNNVIYDTEKVYVAGSLKTQGTDYSIDYDGSGAYSSITFLAGHVPTAGQAITADYHWSEHLASSVLDSYIQRAEKKIDQRIGRSFNTAIDVTEFIDGRGNADLLAYVFNRQYFRDEAQETWPDFNFAASPERLIKLSKYPVLGVSLVGIGVSGDLTYDSSNGNGDLGVGSTTQQAQKFVADQTKFLVAVDVFLKYNTGTAAGLTLGLYADSGGSPTGSALATATLSAISSSTYQHYQFVFNTNPYKLTSGTTYHLVLSSSSSSSTSTYYWRRGTASLLTNSGINTSTNGGSSWTPDTAKNFVFTSFVVDDLVTDSSYRVYYDEGLISVTRESGFNFKTGSRNILVSYSYGYASVPLIVQELAVKMSAYSFIESVLLGGPVPAPINTANAGFLKGDIAELIHVLGERLEARLI